MGLTCLIGGSPLEKLAFQLRLSYTVGDCKNITLWQLRNCILRHNKKPIGQVHFGQAFYEVLKSQAKLLTEFASFDFSKFDETFLLIDGTVSSPVLQVRHSRCNQ